VRNLKYVGFSLAIVLSLGFSGCGGGSGGSSTPTTYTGTFVDAPVQGLNYSTATQSGLTDASGNFKYQAGETVTFKLGTLALGTVPATSSLNPLDLAGDNSLGSVSTKAMNIAMLLQNLDQNRSNTGNIIISSALKDHNFSNVNLSDAGLEASMNALLADGIVSANIDSNNTVITQADATIAMTTYLKSHLAGNYSGDIGVTKTYRSDFTCTNTSNYTINIASSGNDFIITAPITITDANGVGTTRNVVWTTSSFSAFTSSYSSAASPLSDYAYKIENVVFNGETLSGKWYLKSATYGALCDGTYNFTKLVSGTRQSI
jgi:hypothetical protein